ncbi:hypothetical protein JYU34_010552 [Plutella xylostella]|uniref:Uncharacterized protein n=1 Tax=Plutella xylostella TaxID=51655 RepID=A0ABQ7QIQ1_PLUXY|nr:hypothetical protein JYU34_010552 [Plutella xylostella]
MKTDNIQFALTVAPAPTDQDKPTKVKTNNCHSITSLLDIPGHQGMTGVRTDMPLYSTEEDDGCALRY